MATFRLKELVDLRWSDSGDLFLDPLDNDLKDTKKELMQAAIQHLQARLKSSPGDWKHSPQTGAGLDSFAGRANTPTLGADIESRIVNELTRGGFFRFDELRVQAFPENKHSIGIFIQVFPRGQRETMQVVISYSLQDNKISVRN